MDRKELDPILFRYWLEQYGDLNVSFLVSSTLGFRLRTKPWAVMPRMRKYSQLHKYLKLWASIRLQICLVLSLIPKLVGSFTVAYDSQEEIYTSFLKELEEAVMSSPVSMAQLYVPLTMSTPETLLSTNWAILSCSVLPCITCQARAC